MNGNYEKKVIGKLLGFYRQRMNIDKLEIIQISNGKKICSLKTLKKIEEGTVVSDHYYDYLAVSLNMHFSLEENDVKLLQQYHDQLISSLHVFSKSLMTELLYDIEQSLYLMNNVIYFEEMLNLFHDILDYHLNENLPSRSTIDLYLALKEMVNHEDKKLILYFLYQICNVVTYLDRSQIQQECLPFYTDPLFIQNHLLHISQNFIPFDAYHRIKNFYIQIKNQISDYQKITIYSIMAMIQLNMNDVKSAYKTICKILALIKSNPDYPDQLLLSLHMRATIVCYAMKQYEQAIQNALICYHASYKQLNYNHLLLFDALEKTNQISLLINLLKDSQTLSFHNEVVSKIFKYYQIKHLWPLTLIQKHRLLTDLILNQLIPLCKYSELYQNILTEEMLAHVALTRDYKSFYHFLQSNKSNHFHS